MKNSIKILTFITIIVLVLILILGIKQIMTEREIYLQQRLHEANEYILNKYGQELEFDVLNYSEKDTFIANYSLKDDFDVSFRVEYWANKGQFADDFLQQLLSAELKTIISNQISNLGVSNFDVFVGAMNGPPFDLSVRLHEYCISLGHYPKIGDINGKESFSYVTIILKDKLENTEENIRKAVFELDLPIDNIQFK